MQVWTIWLGGRGIKARRADFHLKRLPFAAVHIPRNPPPPHATHFLYLDLRDALSRKRTAIMFETLVSFLIDPLWLLHCFVPRCSVLLCLTELSLA
jgi:hypothetical protein